MKTLKHLFLLEPIDPKWLTQDYRIWQCIMLAAIAGTVLTDAPAWGFVASVVFGGGPIGLVAGCLVGLLMGLLILTAEIGIATADVRASRKFGIATGARFLFLIVSVAYTAMYIATFVLAPDIQHEWNQKITVLVQQKRAALFDARVAELNDRIKQKGRDIDSEVEGRRKSGRVGCGPICAQLQADLANLNGALEKVIGEENDFDRLAVDPSANSAVLATKYGLVLPPLTMKLRNEILAELTEQPGFRATEWTVRAWCVLVFIAMLLAKLAQPEIAKLVFSQKLRLWIGKFDAGELNPMLLPQYWSTAMPFRMTLEILWERVQLLLRDEDKRLQLELINKMKAHVEDAEREVSAAEAKVESDSCESSEARSRRDDLVDSIAAVDRELVGIETARRGVEQSGLSPHRVQGMVDLAEFEEPARQRKGLLVRQLTVANEKVARCEAVLCTSKKLLTAKQDERREAGNQLRVMQVSAANVVASGFARLLGDAPPNHRGSHVEAVAGAPALGRPLKSLAESGKAAIAGLIEERVGGVPGAVSFLRRILTQYFRSKLVMIGVIAALVVAALVATSFFAHTLLAQLHL